MKYFITTDALTRGIYEAEGKPAPQTDSRFGYIILKGRYGTQKVIQPGHFHEAHETAVAKAEEMKAERLAHHRKMIKRLEALKF